MNVCPVCGSIMKPLLYSSYCPNDCGQYRTDWKKYLDYNWYYLVLKQGEIIPPKTTHGWWVLTDERELMTALEYGLPWTLKDKGLSIGAIVKYEYEMGAAEIRLIALRLE